MMPMKFQWICSWIYLFVQIDTFCECVQVNIASILPSDDRRIFSIKRVSPAVEYAIESLHKYNGLLKGHTLKLNYADSKCSIAEAMNHAIDFYIRKEVDVFFGPVCDFSLAPVARQVKFWNIPLVSVGAMARDFTTHRSTLYPLLTRVGPVNFNSLSSFFYEALANFNLKKFKMVYDRDGQDHIVDGFCHLAISAIHYDLLAKAPEIKQDYYKLTEDITKMLKEEISLSFSEYPRRFLRQDSRESGDCKSVIRKRSAWRRPLSEENAPTIRSKVVSVKRKIVPTRMLLTN